MTHTKYARKACGMPLSLIQCAVVFRSPIPINGCEGISMELSIHSCETANGKKCGLMQFPKGRKDIPKRGGGVHDKYSKHLLEVSFVLGSKVPPALPLEIRRRKIETENMWMETTVVVTSRAEEAGESSCLTKGTMNSEVKYRRKEDFEQGAWWARTTYGCLWPWSRHRGAELQLQLFQLRSAAHMARNEWGRSALSKSAKPKALWNTVNMVEPRETQSTTVTLCGGRGYFILKV